MNDPGQRPRRTPPTGGRAWLGATLLACLVLAGCDDTLQPYLDDENAVFSIFGYLDLQADTQWVRVMPARRTLFLDPAPIDAVVTLEHLGSGHTVALNDSLFAFTGPPLESVAYAHNFWTAEPLEPGATYRLTAARSDGASATATIVMPTELEILLLEFGGPDRTAPIAVLQVRAEHLLFVETIYTIATVVGDPPDTVRANALTVSGYSEYPSHVSGMQGIAVQVDSLDQVGLLDMGRREIRVIAGRPDWPYHPELPDLAILLPNTAPSNVEGGLGFVGGVAIWTIPFDSCELLEARPDGEPACRTAFNTESASLAGKVVREPCGDPHALATIRLRVNYAAGGSVIRSWKTGWNGTYRFEGIEPNAQLLLEVGGGPLVHVPPLAAGERYAVEDIPVPGGC